MDSSSNQIKYQKKFVSHLSINQDQKTLIQKRQPSQSSLLETKPHLSPQNIQQSSFQKNEDQQINQMLSLIEEQEKKNEQVINQQGNFVDLIDVQKIKSLIQNKFLFERQKQAELLDQIKELKEIRIKLEIEITKLKQEITDLQKVLQKQSYEMQKKIKNCIHKEVQVNLEKPNQVMFIDDQQMNQVLRSSSTKQLDQNQQQAGGFQGSSKRDKAQNQKIDKTNSKNHEQELMSRSFSKKKGATFNKTETAQKNLKIASKNTQVTQGKILKQKKQVQSIERQEVKDKILFQGVRSPSELKQKLKSTAILQMQKHQNKIIINPRVKDIKAQNQIISKKNQEKALAIQQILNEQIKIYQFGRKRSSSTQNINLLNKSEDFIKEKQFQILNHNLSGLEGYLNIIEQESSIDHSYLHQKVQKATQTEQVQVSIQEEMNKTKSSNQQNISNSQKVQKATQTEQLQISIQEEMNKNKSSNQQNISNSQKVQKATQTEQVQKSVEQDLKKIKSNSKLNTCKCQKVQKINKQVQCLIEVAQESIEKLEKSKESKMQQNSEINTSSQKQYCYTDRYKIESNKRILDQIIYECQKNVESRFTQTIIINKRDFQVQTDTQETSLLSEQKFSSPLKQQNLQNTQNFESSQKKYLEAQNLWIDTQRSPLKSMESSQNLSSELKQPSWIKQIFNFDLSYSQIQNQHQQDALVKSIEETNSALYIFIQSIVGYEHHLICKLLFRNGFTCIGYVKINRKYLQ